MRKILLKKAPVNARLTAFSVLIAVIFICALVARQFTVHDAYAVNMDSAFLPPCREYIFGTDNLGRDIFIRVLYGARISLAIGIVASLLNFFIGVIYGGIAGFCGGKVDRVMMNIVDILYSVIHRARYRLLVADGADCAWSDFGDEAAGIYFGGALYWRFPHADTAASFNSECNGCDCRNDDAGDTGRNFYGSVSELHRFGCVGTDGELGRTGIRGREQYQGVSVSAVFPGGGNQHYDAGVQFSGRRAQRCA